MEYLKDEVDTMEEDDVKQSQSIRRQNSSTKSIKSNGLTDPRQRYNENLQAQSQSQIDCSPYQQIIGPNTPYFDTIFEDHTPVCDKAIGRILTGHFKIEPLSI